MRIKDNVILYSINKYKIAMILKEYYVKGNISLIEEKSR